MTFPPLFYPRVGGGEGGWNHSPLAGAQEAEAAGRRSVADEEADHGGGQSQSPADPPEWTYVPGRGSGGGGGGRRCCVCSCERGCGHFVCVGEGVVSLMCVVNGGRQRANMSVQVMGFWGPATQILVTSHSKIFFSFLFFFALALMVTVIKLLSLSNFFSTQNQIT